MIRAIEIAAALGKLQPTPEQVDIIEAPWDGTYRVIAGAGSGKTETMAQRVLWLVANGHVEPREVLGLTFTRKAAGEFAHRVNERLAQLEGSGVLQVRDEFDGPRIVTYNSFASAVYREYAPLLGRDPDARVLSEASAWALARRSVVASKNEALAHWDYSVSELTRVVRLLASRMSENSVAPDDVDAFVEQFRALGELPPGGSGRYPAVDDWIATIDSLRPMMDLVADYTRAKRARGVIEFSDQVALASQLVATQPEISDRLRGDYRVVLLDEYQDTSVAQTSLLAGLFSRHPVMAVGDPYQAIYGWRGASSSNLADFDTEFGAGAVTTFTLSTSWRNGTEILQIANQVALPLASHPAATVGVLNPAPDASGHAIDVVFDETLEDEAARVASWCAQQISSATSVPSAAVLVRNRVHQRVFVDALMSAGIPVHVLGIGGLLDDPVVADIVCALRVMTQPHAETELIRLLAGGKWRLGVADLHALAGTARWLEGRHPDGSALGEELRDRLRTSVAPLDHAGLRDALSFIAHAPAGHHQRQRYSAVGLERIVDAERTLRLLNDAHIATVDEAIFLVERELGLDTELLANPARSRSVAAREALLDAVHSYLAVSDDSTVAGFVQWLGEAETRDNLTPRAEKPEPGCVQVLTIHGSKGLEWDIVAIPRLVTDELPSAPRDAKGWLSRGELPYDFRGDRDSLPVFGWRSVTTRKEAVDASKDFFQAVKDHRLAEERRLMYVAITRAKHRLLLSGSFWAHQQKPRTPSLFLTELVEAGLIGSLPMTPANDEPPERNTGRDRLWPADPLASRRGLVSAAAQAVWAAADNLPSDASNPDIRRLGVERQGGASGHPNLLFPVRIPASALERLVTSPSEFRSALLRPLPKKPQPAALRGTMFHRYVEDKLGSLLPGTLFDPDDASPDEPSELSIEAWQAKFDASEFATLTPVAIEAELHVPLGAHIIICKIDAVFPTQTGVRIIDWKTGKPPANADELEAKSLQLSAYRIAWSRWSGLPLENIEAALWFVESDKLVTPPRLLDADELELRIHRAVEEITAPVAD
jgi:DNA helicase II / ATP-dependent DNA helicase PcrA